MKTVLHKASTRGYANHGWLESYHTFSFANYYNPERIQFGALRVLNDDKVSGGEGFGRHPHDNMEIVSIPLEGELEHKDSMGNIAIIKKGEIQVMSAGTGIYHSEYNKNENDDVRFLQIWVLPNKRNVTPRYDQISINNVYRENTFYQVVSPNPDEEGVWIYQEAWFHLGDFTSQTTYEYDFRKKGNGVYIFILEGEAIVEGQKLERRDGFGIRETEKVKFRISKDSRILLMEVPL